MNNCRQIVVFGDKHYIDKNAKGYILLEPYMRNRYTESLLGEKYISLGYPFSEKELLDVTKYSIEITKRLIKEFGRAINEYKGLDYTERQWSVIMSIWFQQVTMDICYRYTKLKNYKNSNCYIVGPDFYPIENRAAIYLRNNEKSHIKNAFLWTIVGSMLGINIRYVDVRKIESIKIFIIKVKSFIRNLIKEPYKTIEYFIAKILGKKVSDIKTCTFHNISSIARTVLYDTTMAEDMEKKCVTDSCGVIDRLLHDEIRYESDIIIARYKKNMPLRNKLFSNVFNPENEFEAILKQIIISHMPVCFFEAVNDFSDRAKEITASWNVNKIYSATPSDELFDFCEAEVVGRGTLIYGIQHSAAYGAFRLSPIAEFMIYDYFLSWGWKIKVPFSLRAKLKPIAMLRLPLQCNEINSGKHNILFVCNYGFLSGSGLGITCGWYVERELDFIKNLKKEHRERLVLRIDPNDSMNQELVYRCKAMFPYIQVENRYEIPFGRSLSNCEIVVNDYYGSSHLEALINKKPFVIFNAMEIISYNPAILPFLNEMKQLGIYVNSGFELASVLNKYDSLHEWTSSRAISNFYKKYLEYFAGGDRDCIYDIWYNEFIENNKN